ncbi:prepilin-type N-terminal cleavage/methylation domain-containing protein [Psychromonas sp. RZ22]|uniref:prepilin-type N-terminal cleavage/methylation domain-containing protein n=1 Tax=Psychromonas algarum TaxID=2555643 RepID=UPI0010682AB3|nr:prepilin-type N-terminal cleavage/methylation domain-containing protein [Psychromonas sp. RZ22]TEW56677.1 prepilin-type N-terminal cleavage/methylation domain-containing protein [Psychromonas sp. RZ22]
MLINKLTHPSLTKGFTLIELVIVIIILAALGIATTTYIGKGLNIYNEISDRDKSLNSIRFAMERMRREASNALPNSVKVENGCLSFYPVKNSSLYLDLPVYPIEDNQAVINVMDDYSYDAADKAVVYLLNASELFVSDANGSSKVQSITGINTAMDTLSLSGDISFPLSSPAKRLYIINERLQYCMIGDDLYRQKNQETGVLMAENISGTFEVINATLQRNSLVKVNFSLPLNDLEVAFEQTLHINNVP